jgi:hypothetical protein
MTDAPNKRRNGHGRNLRVLWSTLPLCAGFVVQQFIMWPLRRLREWLIAHVVERAEVNGILVIIDGDDSGDRDRVCAGLSEALEKLTAWAPRMRRRMEVEVRQILVEPGRNALYLHPGTIVIGLQAFHLTDSDAVASYIVHEAVHARIETRGIRYWPHLRARIERRCLREQLEFLASRGRTDLVEQYERYCQKTWADA